MLNNNGSALTKKRAEQIIDSGLTRLRFSLDAFTPETYSKVRWKYTIRTCNKKYRLFLDLRAKKIISYL